MDNYFYSAFIYFADGTTGHGDGIVPYDRNLVVKDFEYIKKTLIQDQLQKQFTVKIEYFSLIQFNRVN